MKIKFVPQGIEVEVDPNKSLMQLAMENGVLIHSVCKGVPSCGECRVKIVEGENNVTKPSKAEINLIGSSYYIDGRRLSCQVKCFGPVTVDTSEQIERQDHPSKKLRGFKSKKQYESTAVLDTMLLTEAPTSTDLAPSASEVGTMAKEDNRKGGDPGHRGQRNQNRRHRRPKGKQRR